LPGNPYDGHTLANVIPAMEALVGNVLNRIVTDAGYRGHNAPPAHRFQVYVAGQKRGVTDEIKRAFKRRAAIEPVIRPRRTRCSAGATRRHSRNWWPRWSMPTSPQCASPAGVVRAAE
jgi:hypothetical protein